jgi:hypothetical protein
MGTPPLAICLECGHEKTGALAVCPACGYQPGDDPIAQAKSLLLSDHHAMPAELRTASSVIRSGGKPELDRARLAALVDELERTRLTTGRFPGLGVVRWALLLLVVTLVVYVVYAYL